MKEAYRIVCSLCTNMIRMTKYDIFCRPASAGRFSSEKVVTVNLTSTAWYKQQSGEHDGIFTLRQPLLTHAAREWVSERKERERGRAREERRGGGKESERMRGVENGQRVEMRPRELLKQERERERKEGRDRLSWQAACVLQYSLAD